MIGHMQQLSVQGQVNRVVSASRASPILEQESTQSDTYWHMVLAHFSRSQQKKRY